MLDDLKARESLNCLWLVTNWKYFMQISCPVRLEISLEFLLVSKHSVGLTIYTYHLSCFIVLNFKPLYNGFLLGSIFGAFCVRSFLLAFFFFTPISMKMNMRNRFFLIFTRYIITFFVCIIWSLISISRIFYLWFKMKYVKQKSVP